MKILHVFDHSIPLHSGYSFRSRSILLFQRKMGWETEQITGPKHNVNYDLVDKEEMVDGLHFYRTPPATTLTSRLPVVNQYVIVTELQKRLREIIPIVKPDIIHAHSPSLNGWAAINAGKSFGIPIVYEIRAFWEDAAVDHGTTTEGSLRYKLSRAIETRVVKKADAVTTICNGLKQDLILRGIPESKITVIPNAVDLESFSENRNVNIDLKKNLDLVDKKVIGFIGSFYAYEGIDQLIWAMNDIKEVRNDIRILLVGGGPQDSNIKELVNRLSLNKQVLFIGRVPHDQVRQYYDLVDIFVYPRISMRLTDLVTPLKPLEAMAQRKLVVASDVGGHKELIEDGKTGILFPAGNVKVLAEKLLDLFNNENNWGEIRNAGRQYVEEVRNWENSVKRYESIYANLSRLSD